MIQSKRELYDFLEHDNIEFSNLSKKERLIEKFVNYPSYAIKKYTYYLRMQEYYINTAKGNKIKGLLGIYYEKKKNKLGLQLGIEIGPNCFGKGLQIYHSGSIIVNSAAIVGENCKLHGNNCIGNKGTSKAVPHIGNNVDIGYGAVLIGDIEIADNVIIGANTLVNKSVLESGTVIVGIPGKAIL